MRSPAAVADRAAVASIPKAHTIGRVMASPLWFASFCTGQIGKALKPEGSAWLSRGVVSGFLLCPRISPGALRASGKRGGDRGANAGLLQHARVVDRLTPVRALARWSGPLRGLGTSRRRRLAQKRGKPVRRGLRLLHGAARGLHACAQSPTSSRPI